jgi:nucleoside-diphosphate-sugar epimerase
LSPNSRSLDDGLVVLVTGGFGFIGAHVVRDLVQSGASVIVVDRQPDANSAAEVLSATQLASVQVVGRSIPGLRTLTRVLREWTVDTVVHLASPLATVTEGRPRISVDEMIAPQLALLEASRLAKVRRFVWASSVGVFGRVHDYERLPIDNDAPHFPFTLYGAAKSFLERLSSHYSTRYGVDTLGLRFPLVYGPSRKRGGGQFTTELIEGAALGKRCVVESADERYDWMYVADAARSVLRAIRAASVSSRVVTVGGEVASTRSVVEMLHDWFPDAELVALPGSTDLVADFDPQPAFAELGYRPVQTLKEGVLETANAARRRAGLPQVA